MGMLRSKPNCPLSSLHGGLGAWLLGTHLGGGVPGVSATRQGHSHVPFPLVPCLLESTKSGDVESDSGRGRSPPCLGGPPHLLSRVHLAAGPQPPPAAPAGAVFPLSAGRWQQRPTDPILSRPVAE